MNFSHNLIGMEGFFPPGSPVDPENVCEVLAIVGR